MVWKVNVPPAPSSPCVWGDRIFLTAFDGGKLETHCYQRRDGKLLWKRDALAEKLEDFNTAEGSPAASTPVTDGKLVVSYFGSCGLICHDFAGKEIWRHPLPVAQSAGGFGTGGSPALAGGLVLVGRDLATGCSLLAVELKSGKKVWETARPDVLPSFGSPIFWKNNGKEEVVMSGSLKLKGYDLKTGAERWSLAGMPSFTCTTPVVGEGLLFLPAGRRASPTVPCRLLQEWPRMRIKTKTGSSLSRRRRPVHGHVFQGDGHEPGRQTDRRGL